MLGYVIRRVLFAIPIALGVSVVCFSLVYLAPGDPLQTVLPPDATAETKTGSRHIIEYLLSPLLRRTHQALRER